METKNHINLNYLQTACANNKAIMRKMIEMFIEKTPALMNEIHHSITENKTEQTKQLAHKVKSSFQTMGANLVGKTLQEIETGCNSSTNDLLAKINYAKNQGEMVYNELKETLKTI